MDLDFDLGFGFDAAVGLRFLTADRVQALLESGHQVRRLGRLRLLARGADHLLAGGLALEQVEQLLAVLVAIPLGLKSLVRDSISCLAISSSRFSGFFGFASSNLVVEVLGRGDLVVEAHRGQGEDVIHRPDRSEVLLVAEHEAGDRDLARSFIAWTSSAYARSAPLSGPR